MATSAVPDKQGCSDKDERPEGDSRRDGKEQDESTPATQRRGIVERAMEDPGLLTWKELECLVRVLCAKAARQAGIAKFVADFCISVSSKKNGRAFVDLLMSSIHEWSDRREELLPRRVPPAGDRLEGKTGEEPLYKWTMFVDFLTELLAAMVGAGWGTRGHRSYWRVSDVAGLLCDCLDTMLRCPAYDVLDEVKCLQSSLLAVGKTVESFTSFHFDALVGLMLGATKKPQFPPEAQKLLFELVELRNFGWESRAK